MKDTRSKIAVLGLTYKGDIDDVRESSELEVVEKSLEQGYPLGVPDPHGSQEQVEFKLSIFVESVEDADSTNVLMDHNKFKVLDEEAILAKTNRPFVLETRNCVKISSEEIEYVNFGNLTLVSSVQVFSN